MTTAIAIAGGDGGVLNACGGLGIFLIGMFVMTEGLKAVAGSGMKKFIGRFTRTPVSGAVTGALATAVIQSSSATTVAAVGFVGASLMTFTQALGIIFGANIGTTITGWIVALIGFKFKIGLMAGPMVFLGAVLRLFGRNQLKAVGQALAGFGLIFIGISMLQAGLAGLSDTVTPERFPDNTLTGRMLLVLIGIAITLVTQSSSASVATAITAVHAGSISLPQAAAMVIGMDIGTTITAYVATLGGSTQARRTGYAHVIYNLMTGVAAFIFLGFYMAAWEKVFPAVMSSDPEMVLVAFHTLFNLIGVIVALPFTSQFAKLIVRLVPEDGRPATSRLDRELFRDPDAAVGLATTILRNLLHRATALLADALKGKVVPDEAIHELEKQNHLIREELFEIRTEPRQLPARFLSVLHVVDHMDRLLDRLKKEKPVGVDRGRGPVEENVTLLAEHLPVFQKWLDDPLQPVPDSERVWVRIDESHADLRTRIMESGTLGSLNAEEVMKLLDAERWVRRVAYHVARVTSYLAGLASASGPAEDDESLRRRDPDPA